jgi:hypothetical protein
MPTPEQTDALYDVLGVARRFLAAELRLERAAHLRGLAAVEPLRFDRNDALQRLRDTLFESRGVLLREPRPVPAAPPCGDVDPLGEARCELPAAHEDEWHQAGHRTWKRFNPPTQEEKAA